MWNAIPLHHLTLLKENWIVIIGKNAMFTAFVVMSVIPNFVFSSIAPTPTRAMEEIMAEIIVAQPGLILITILFTIKF